MSRLNFTILIMHDYMESGVLYLHLALDSNPHTDVQPIFMS